MKSKLSTLGLALILSALIFSAASPEVVAISVGPNQRDHPVEQMLACRRVGSRVYETDQQGTIIVTSDGNTYSVTPTPVETSTATLTLTPTATSTPCVLFGDLDGDGDVDVDDIMLVASRWRTSCDNPDPDNDPDTPNYEARYDLDGDCDIDIVDIMNVVAHWGETCPTLTVDDVLAQCPTAEEIASVNAELTLSFEGDPTAGTLVCTAAAGSADLTRLQERTYQAVLMMKRIQFDAPLHWTDKSLYDWFVHAIDGIRFRSDITYSFCCEPPNIINIQTNNLAALSTNRWIDPSSGEGLQGLVAVLVHEARHNEGFPHTCGSKDNTIAELGSWGVQYYLLNWIAYHSDPCFITSTDPWPTYYCETARYSADMIRATRFCLEPTPTPGPPVPTCQ